MAEISIRQFANLLSTIAAQVSHEEKQAKMHAAEAMVKTAKEMVGSEGNGWPPLAESTIAEKERLGYTGHVSATDPLLRTGEYRDSFSVTEGPPTQFGTTDENAAVHEFGNAHEPPRPVVGPATLKHSHEVGETFAKWFRNRLLRG